MFQSLYNYLDFFFRKQNENVNIHNDSNRRPISKQYIRRVYMGNRLCNLKNILRYVCDAFFFLCLGFFQYLWYYFRIPIASTKIMCFPQMFCVVYNHTILLLLQARELNILLENRNKRNGEPGKHLQLPPQIGREEVSAAALNRTAVPTVGGQVG